MWSSILVAVFGIVALMTPTSANVGLTCSANQDECDELTGGYCDLDGTDGPKCACAAINDGATDATTCTPKDCSSGATVCTTADANSVCVNNKCACNATSELTGADDSSVCVAKDCSTDTTACDVDSNSVCVNKVCVCKAAFEQADDSAVCVAKVIGSSCLASEDCAGITGAVCDTVKAICSCPATSTANTEGNACAPNKIGSSCTANGGECADITNSVCETSGQNPVCTCPATHRANEDENECVLIEIGSSCTADGGECAVITNSVCDTSGDNSVCACPATHTENTAQNTCNEKVCSEDTTCATAESPNAICSGGKCTCNVTMEISNSQLCQVKVIGSSCTADGGECANIAGAVCDTSGHSSTCACPDTHEANQDGSQCSTRNNAIAPVGSMALLFICCLSTFLRQV